ATATAWHAMEELVSMGLLPFEILIYHVQNTRLNRYFKLLGNIIHMPMTRLKALRFIVIFNVAATAFSLAAMPFMFGVDEDKLASIMFLYLQHPNEKVTSASHSVMVSFLSSGSDADQDDRAALKERLAFYYIKRSLEAYPGLTPFDGLASGVAALVRHLPAGSAAILFCIHSLAVKAKDLCETANVQNKSLWRSWEESTDPCKKTLDLLLRLIFLVDIQ
ncbi:hypothetical protein ACJX0J_024478, partial [Zea mays]